MVGITLESGHDTLDRAFQIALGDVCGNVRAYRGMSQNVLNFAAISDTIISAEVLFIQNSG